MVRSAEEPFLESVEQARWGHRGWRQFTDADLNGTGVWTLTNLPFLGATHVSPTAIATARKHLGYNGTDSTFDFGRVYGNMGADPHRHVRSMDLLRDLGKDHKLTKADLMLTLSDHGGIDGKPHEPFVQMPSFGSGKTMTIDWWEPPASWRRSCFGCGALLMTRDAGQ